MFQPLCLSYRKMASVFSPENGEIMCLLSVDELMYVYMA